MDQRPDTGDEQRHRDRQRIDEEPELHLEAANRQPVEQHLLELPLRVRLVVQADEDHHRGRERAAAHQRREPSGQRLAELPPCDHEDEEARQRQRGDQPDEFEHASVLIP